MPQNFILTDTPQASQPQNFILTDDPGHRRSFRIPHIGWENGGPTFGTQTGIKGPGDQLAVDAVEGLNRWIADVLDAPEMLVRSVWKTATSESREPEVVWGTMAKLFKQAGITDPEAKLNPMMEDFGVDTLAALTGFGVAAKASRLTPRAIDAGASFLQRFSSRAVNTGQKVGKAIVENPGGAAISEAAASLGGSGLANTPGIKGTGWENTARVAGSTLAGGIPALTAGTRLASRSVPKAALLGETRDPSMVTQYSAEALAFEQGAIDAEIDNMVTAVARPNPNVDPLTAARSSAKVATRVTRQANSHARNIEGDLWVTASVGRDLGNEPLQEFWQSIKQQYGQLGQAPMAAELARIGHRIEKLPPHGKLSDQVGAGSIRSEILDYMGNMAASRDGGGIAYKDLNDLQGHIIEGVRKAYPNDDPITAAHEWSRWRNDRFTRDDSRLKPFVDGTFDEVDHPKLVANLINHSGGGDAVRDVSRRLKFTKLVTAYQRNIRDQFVSITSNWGKQGRSPAEIQKNRKDAADWISRPEIRTFMNDLPTEMADTHLAANHLVERLDARALIASSAFNRIAGDDIGKVAQGVLETGDKAAAVRAIMDGIAAARTPGIGHNSVGPGSGDITNDLARNGFQAEVINRLFASAQYDPAKLQQMITSRQDYKKMLHELLPGRGLDDFYSIVKDAMSIQRNSIAAGDISRAKTLVKGPAKVIAKVLGASMGRGLGTGTIQAPAVGSGFLGSIAEKYFAQIDPSTVLGRAVIDPYFRRMLHASIPRNRREHGQLFRAVTAAASVATALMHKVENNTGIQYLDPSIRPKAKGKGGGW